jgi:hypothetical protein
MLLIIGFIASKKSHAACVVSLYYMSLYKPIDRVIKLATIVHVKSARRLGAASRGWNFLIHLK